nr:uncharacterized protein LOC109149193 [Ipomoea trifida]
MGDFHLLFAFCLIFSTLNISSARDTITLDDPLHENETIISSGGTFEMGFFRPSSTSLNRYVGIWYKKIIPKIPVWVANRKAPLSTNASSVALKILSQSQQLLALLTDTNDVVLSVNTLSSSPISLQNPVMQLLDSGNLVVRDAGDGGDENQENFLWQSFDYPTDTYLPGMKMGINFETGHEVYLSAWKSAEDPSPSDYTSNLLVTGYPQGIIRRGKAMIYRSGPWNGVKWSGIPSPDINPIYNYDLFINKTEIYTNFSLVNESVISVLYINYTGVVHRLMWVEGMRNWITIGKLPTDDCDRYGNCGGNGLCNIGNFPVCGCLNHFLPRNQAEWGMANFAGGCGRRRSLDCQSGKDAGGFLNYSGIKLPDTQNSWYNETMTIQECQQECWKNCSCTAFSSLDVRNGGSGCLMWFGDLVDIRQMAGRGQDIFIRLASSELGFRREHRKILEIVAVTLSSVIGLFLISGLSLMLYVRRKKKTNVLRDKDFELPVFHLRTIARATNNFSADNKLGEGGFGPVYKFLKDGDTIISEGGTFVMGFFSPTNSLNRYIGIWYKQIPVQTVVWVANRDAPMANTSSAVLKITPGGELTLVGDKSQAVWSANSSRSVQNPVAELLDSGNLVVRDADDENPENFLWQSFDYPTDNWLPGMKFGWNLQTGHEAFLTAWNREDDPASGQFTLHLDTAGYPQVIIRNGTSETYGTGPWNGLRFSGMRSEGNNTETPYGLVINQKEVYLSYGVTDGSSLLRLVLSSNGVLQSIVWDLNQWVSFPREPSDLCDSYGLCGGNGVCNIDNFPSCGCLDRFLPNDNAAQNWLQGCHRRKPLNCHNGFTTDGFVKYSGIKLPDAKNSWYNESMSLQECEELCLRNCSCMAYSPLDISDGGSGCLVWSGDLIDIRSISSYGQDIYIKLASTEIPGLLISWYFGKKKTTEQKLKKELELQIFDWSTILRATNNFSEKNKLGQGGFGTGALDGGEEIAVKRLSKNSTQGLVEFKNEVICIAKLQHRNLVKLLGCCISGEEKMLVYEYMPNKSLDIFIFGMIIF